MALNIAVIAAVAAVVDLVPGGGRGAGIALQVIWLIFLATFLWFGVLMYRQNRVAVYSLGDRRRALLYAALAVATLTLTATSRLWLTPGGQVAWLVLLALAIYAVITIAWSARRY